MNSDSEIFRSIAEEYGAEFNLRPKHFGVSSVKYYGVVIDFIEKYKNTNLCGSCSKCIDICPTNAFIGPYKLDARRCISYLTIEYKGNIPREYRSLIGNRIYGCDDCLAICPWNKFAKITKNINFKERKELINPNLGKLYIFFFINCVPKVIPISGLR